MSKKTMPEIIGTRTVYIRTSPNDTKRATVAVTIAADGTAIPSTIIFKGKPDGRIARTEFSAYPPPTNTSAKTTHEWMRVSC